MWPFQPHSSIQIILSRPLPYSHPFLLLQWPLCWPPQQQALLQCLWLQKQQILWHLWLNLCLWATILSLTLLLVYLPHLPPSPLLPLRISYSPAWLCLTRISSGSSAVLPTASRTQNKQWVMYPPHFFIVFPNLKTHSFTKSNSFSWHQSIIVFVSMVAHSNKVLRKWKRFSLRQPYQWEGMLVSWGVLNQNSSSWCKEFKFVLSLYRTVMIKLTWC